MKADSTDTRQLTVEDWKLLRDLRLQALKECEGMYLARYEENKNFTEDKWKDMIFGSNKAIFGLFENENHIGIGGIYTSEDDSSGKTGVLVMGFIIPEYRRQGLSHKLYEARINWAQSHPLIEKLEVSHRKNNEASRKSMIKHGFKPDGEQRLRFGDGQEDTDYQYVLDLKK